jgi:hypothetical protein
MYVSYIATLIIQTLIASSRLLLRSRYQFSAGETAKQSAAYLDRRMTTFRFDRMYMGEKQRENRSDDKREKLTSKKEEKMSGRQS